MSQLLPTPTIWGPLFGDLFFPNLRNVSKRCQSENCRDTVTHCLGEQVAGSPAPCLPPGVGHLEVIYITKGMPHWSVAPGYLAAALPGWRVLRVICSSFQQLISIHFLAYTPAERLPPFKALPQGVRRFIFCGKGTSLSPGVGPYCHITLLERPRR